MNRLALLAASLGACCLGFGCQSLRQPFPDRAFYIMLDDESPATTPGPDAVHVHVARAQIPAPFGSRAFQYRIGESEYESDYYNAWADEPGELFRSALMRTLNGHAEFVATAGPVGDARGVSIALDVDALYVDAAERGTRVSVVAFTATVRDMAGETLLTRRYRAETDSASASGGDVLGAWNSGLSGQFTMFADDLHGALFRTDRLHRCFLQIPLDNDVTEIEG